MRNNYAVWTGLLIIVILVTLTMKYYAYFPGDVTVEKWIQSLVPPNLNWAEGVSKTAEFPWIFLILAIIFAFSWVLAGWRAALLAVMSFMGILALENGWDPLLAGHGLPRNWCACSGRFRAIAFLPCLL